MAKYRSAFGRVLRRKGRDGRHLPGFYVRVRIDDKETTRWAGPDRKTAAEFLANLLRQNAREDLLGEKAIASLSFTEFRPFWDAHLTAKHGATTVKGDRGRLDAIVKWFGTRALADIGSGDVQDFLAHLKNEEGLSRATVNRYASALSVAFRFAVEKGFARSNPVKGITRPKESERPIPFVSSSDVDRLIAACSNVRFRALIRILSDTGLRREEAVRLVWRDIDLGRGALTVNKSKSGLPRDVPLTAAAKTAFRDLRATAGPVAAVGSEVLWPEFQGRWIDRIEGRFRRLRKRTGRPTLRLHDLRHGLGSRLAQVGVPIPTIAAILGHLCLRTTMRYAGHVPDGATVEAIRRLEKGVSPAPEVESPGYAGGDAAAPGLATNAGGGT